MEDSRTHSGSTEETPPPSFDLGEKLSQRLHEYTQDKARTQNVINHGNTQLQNLIKNAPKRPRDGKPVLNDKIKKLERDRTSRSLPLSQEKALIRQIAAAQKTIRQHDDCEAHQEAIRRKRAEIESSREALRTINASIAEIEKVLSTVELAKNLGCSPSKLVTQEVFCPVEKLGRVIGKNGTTISAIEKRVGVRIEVDKLHGKIYVRGSKNVVDDAVRQVEMLTLAVDEELDVSADVSAYLLTQVC
jgi:predicted RNA-binding protein YlqC (UPF0109 family)